MSIEKEAFEKLQSPLIFERIVFIESANLYIAKDDFQDDLFTLTKCNELNFGWQMWQASKAKAVPKGFVLMPKEPTDEIIEAMNEFDYRNDYSDMDGAYRTIVETLEKAQEDAEREQKG